MNDGVRWWYVTVLDFGFALGELLQFHVLLEIEVEVLLLAGVSLGQIEVVARAADQEEEDHRAGDAAIAREEC